MVDQESARPVPHREHDPHPCDTQGKRGSQCGYSGSGSQALSQRVQEDQDAVCYLQGTEGRTPLDY